MIPLYPSRWSSLIPQKDSAQAISLRYRRRLIACATVAQADSLCLDPEPEVDIAEYETRENNETHKKSNE
jgi:hypothetical protein